ncbi:MAG TPA: PIN domain-containing protein [Anaerolineae bacterium]|nr:PIN domain-containing protein [Anaerolineae bacterium]
MPAELQVFLDADVIFAGSAAPSEHGASQVVLRMGEITLLDCVTSQQTITEVERNLQEKLPNKLSEFRLIVTRSLRVVPDPDPADLSAYEAYADSDDLPLLVAALREECPFFLTFNLRHYHPRGLPIKVIRPGDFLRTVRERLLELAAARSEE